MARVRDRALPCCWSIHVCVGLAVAPCLVERSLGSSRPNGPEGCSNAPVILCNVTLGTDKCSRVPRLPGE